MKSGKTKLSAFGQEHRQELQEEEKECMGGADRTASSHNASECSDTIGLLPTFGKMHAAQPSELHVASSSDPIRELN